jgi:hypothetical protein
VAEPAAAALEVAITDAGLLLVELEKFQAGHREPATTLRAEALALGQHARRLHRASALNEAAAERLVREAGALVERLRDALRAVRAAPAFRAAVAAHQTGDHGTLVTLLPTLFEGLEHVATPPPLLRSVTWLRRNRPRPPAEVAADVARLRDAGMAAEGDAQTPGTDPELPAVTLLADPPDEPILLRFAPGTLPPAVFRLRDTGEHLVHVPLLRAPFEVVLPQVLDPDEVGEIPLDHPRYRAQLVEALAGVGLPGRSD